MILETFQISFYGHKIYKSAIKAFVKQPRVPMTRAVFYNQRQEVYAKTGKWKEVFNLPFIISASTRYLLHLNKE